MYRLFAIRDELNGLVYPIPGVGKVFDNLSLNQPKFIPAELGFIRSVSWLYGLYYEAGKIGVAFLVKTLPVYELDAEELHLRHHGLVRDIRTFTSHNLDLSAIHDKKLVTICQNWFQEACGTFVPIDEEHWQPLIFRLLRDAVSFLEALKNCVRLIESDDRKNLICAQWTQKLKRYYPPHMFDSLIPEVLADIGRDQMDPERFRKKYYSDWARTFEGYSDDLDFEVEARRLIESAALSEARGVLPISGKDLINYFDLAPGPEVGNLLEIAKGIYIAEKCDKKTLLSKLAEKRSADSAKGE